MHRTRYERTFCRVLKRKQKIRIIISRTNGMKHMPSPLFPPKKKIIIPTVSCTIVGSLIRVSEYNGYCNCKRWFKIYPINRILSVGACCCVWRSVHYTCRSPIYTIHIYVHILTYYLFNRSVET